MHYFDISILHPQRLEYYYREIKTYLLAKFEELEKEEWLLKVIFYYIFLIHESHNSRLLKYLKAKQVVRIKRLISIKIYQYLSNL